MQLQCALLVLVFAAFVSTAKVSDPQTRFSKLQFHYNLITKRTNEAFNKIEDDLPIREEPIRRDVTKQYQEAKNAFNKIVQNELLFAKKTGKVNEEIKKCVADKLNEKIIELNKMADDSFKLIKNITQTAREEVKAARNTFDSVNLPGYALALGDKAQYNVCVRTKNQECQNRIADGFKLRIDNCAKLAQAQREEATVAYKKQKNDLYQCLADAGSKIIAFNKKTKGLVAECIENNKNKNNKDNNNNDKAINNEENNNNNDKNDNKNNIDEDQNVGQTKNEKFIKIEDNV